MIKIINTTVIVITCSKCGKDSVVAGEWWESVLKIVVSMGWKIKVTCIGEWMHYCPECAGGIQ